MCVCTHDHEQSDTAGLVHNSAPGYTVVLAGMLNQPPMYIIHPGPDHSHADYICTMVARM